MEGSGDDGMKKNDEDAIIIQSNSTKTNPKPLQLHAHGCKHWTSLGEGVRNRENTYTYDVVDAEAAKRRVNNHQHSSRTKCGDVRRRVNEKSQQLGSNRGGE